MNESLSIDEIIRQAEEIRKKTVKQAQSALEDVNTSANEITKREIEVPKPDIENIKIQPKSENVKTYEKSTALDKTKVGPAIKAEDDGKTKHIDFKPKSKSDDFASQKTVQKSFFTSNRTKEPIYSKKPPEIIERPATIKSKSRFDKTGDLEEIPTIVAVEELEKTKISLTREEIKEKEEKAQEQREEEQAVQIVLDGFDDETKQIDKIDEELAEKQLKERRKEKVNKFRIFSPEDIEDAAKADKDTVIKKEYESADEQSAFSKRLDDARSSASLNLKITFALTFVLGLLTGFKDSSYLPSLLLDSTPYIITLLVLFVIVCVVNARIFMHGFKLKGGINSDFPICVAEIIVFVHTILLLIDSNLLLDDGTLYPFAGAFALLLSGLGKYTFITRIRTDFDFIANQKEKYTVEPIVNKVDAGIISRGLLTGEPNLKASIKTDFATKFLDISSVDEPADKIGKYVGSVSLLLNKILAVVVGLINQNWHLGVNAFVCAMCITTPCYALFCTNNTLLGVSKQLRTRGAMVNGFEGASVTSDANAIVIEAQNLFGPRSCEIHGIKTFNGAKADDVILKTASVIINTKSPLASVFDDVIIGKQAILPEVDDIVYEDRLGTTGWIYRKKILVGTRDLLIHHGVPVLKEDFEKKYTRKGRRVLYLAEAGKLMAMFVVSYSADPQLKKALRKLEKSGMTILVRSADPFINDESIAELFELPDGYIRVMNSSNGRAFEKYSNLFAQKSPAYIVHNGSALGLVSAFSAAEDLQETRKLISVLISFGSALGLGVVGLLAFVGGIDQLDAIKVALFQAAWCIFVNLLAKIKSLFM